MPLVLLDAIFWVAVACCAVAQIFIVRAVLRVVRPPSAHTADAASSPVPLSMPVPRQSLEIVWAVLPAGLVVVAFVAAWGKMHPSV